MPGRALREYHGVYRFESDSGVPARHLVLGGKAFVCKKRPPEGHLTFTLHQPEALSFRSRPDQLLEIVIGNKIGQRGNTHYLYQRGFVLIPILCQM